MCGRAEELVHSRFFVNVVRALAKNRCRAVVARVENHLAQSALVAAGRMAAAWKWREVRASPLSLLSHRNPQQAVQVARFRRRSSASTPTRNAASQPPAEGRNGHRYAGLTTTP